jgi:NAD(P)H dehydrogenase (quinone)
MNRIAVTGANGEFGRGVVEHLLKHLDADSLIVTVRETSRAQVLAERGVAVHAADFDDGEALTTALSGADTALVNATFFGVQPELRGARVATAIRSAAEAGVSRLVVTSWPEIDDCPLELTRDFVATEQLASSIGPDFTLLRLGYGMADSIARDVVWALRAGQLRAPAGNARCTPAAVPDLIEATARVLLGSGHEGRRYELSAARAIGWNDLAALASSLGGHPIPYEAVSDGEFRTQLEAMALPESAITGLLGYYAAFRSGWANEPHTDLEILLGRPAVDPLEAVGQRVQAFGSRFE